MNMRVAPCAHETPAFACRSLAHAPVLPCQRPRRAERRVKARSFQDPPPAGGERDGEEDGDPKLQDALVNMIKLEIEKKQVEEYVEESGEKLKQLAEEAKEEIERMGNLGRLRGEVAFDSAMADINREADEFEEQLRRNREELEAEDAEFSAWESGMAASRSEGQFFKTLYQDDKKKPVGEDLEALKARAARVKEPARQEINSPVRFYLFMALAFLLVADVGADLATDTPSWGPDLLYSGLSGIAVWLAINEKRSGAMD